MKKKSKIQTISRKKLKPIVEPHVKVLYVKKLVQIIEKFDTNVYRRNLKLLKSLDEFMKSRGLRITITVASENRNQFT